ncbi:MAG: amino acid permease [Nitrososphaeria archaeon]|jgi:amino acid transporter
MTEKSDVFIRQSTGLVKNVSFFDAVALNISNMSGGAALATIGLTMVLFPIIGISVTGMNLVYGSILAFLFSIPQIIVYTIMTRRLSRTGGDYIWVSRTLGGMFGSALSFMGYTLETLAYLALIVLSAVFAVGSVGVIMGNGGFLGLALPGSIPGADTTSQFLLGSLIFLVLVLLNIFKPKAGYKLVSILTIVGVATLLIAVAVILGAGKEGVVSYANSIASSSNNANLTYNAISGSYSGTSFDFGATLLLLPFFAIFVYPWLNAGPAVASEIRGRKAIKWNVPLASFIIFALVTGGFAVMYYVGGVPFTNAALSNPIYVYDNFFNFWTLAMGVTSNVVLQWIIGIGWIVWNLSVLAYGIIVFSRYMFAQSFDRFLPSRLAYISPKYGSPVIVHVVDLVITVGLIGAVSYYYGTLTSLFGAVIASMIYFVFIGLAAAVYGSRKEKGGTKATLIVCGLLQAVVFLFIIYEFLAYSGVWGGNILAYGYAAGSFIAGLAIYLTSKWYHAKKGMNIDLAFKEIPPE